MTELSRVAASHLDAFERRHLRTGEVVWAVGAGLLRNYTDSISAMGTEPPGVIVSTGEDLHFFREEGLGAFHCSLPMRALGSTEFVKHRESVGSNLLELDLVVANRTDGVGPWGIMAIGGATDVLLRNLASPSGSG